MRLEKYLPYIASILSGLMLWAAWPTYGCTPLIFFALVPLLYLEDFARSNPRSAVFLPAYLCFLVWNVLTTYWVWNSSPAAVLAFVVNSLLMAAVFYAYHICTKNCSSSSSRAAVLIIFWLAFESLHFEWDLAWPWLCLGNVFCTQVSWIQWYEITGSLGGSIWVWLSNILLYSWIKARFLGRRAEVGSFFGLNLGCGEALGGGAARLGAGGSVVAGDGAASAYGSAQSSVQTSAYTKKQITIKALLFASVVLIPILFSNWRFHTYKPSGEDVEVVVVQPNIDPYEEQYSISPLEALERMLFLAEYHLDSNTHFLVSPESMIQEYVWEDEIDQSRCIAKLKDFVKDYKNLEVLAGISSLAEIPREDSLHKGARRRLNSKGETEFFYLSHNTAIAVNKNSREISLRHKSKLTPAVEIMPFVDKIPFLENLAIDLGGTIGTLGVDSVAKVFEYGGGEAAASGEAVDAEGGYSAELDGGAQKREPCGERGQRTANPIKYANIICYESVFGDYVSQFVKNGAQLLFISTNDAWWGNTAGHKQHCAYARLRAIENRRDIARSANTGISCFIDQRGVETQKTEYWKPACIKATLKANSAKTIYSTYGDIISRVSMPFAVLLFVACILLRFLKRR